MTLSRSSSSVSTTAAAAAAEDDDVVTDKSLRTTYAPPTCISQPPRHVSHDQFRDSRSSISGYWDAWQASYTAVQLPSLLRRSTDRLLN